MSNLSMTSEVKPDVIWNFLSSWLGNDYGTAGLMGNLYAESGLKSINLENLCEKRLKEAGKSYCTDELYTKAVDDGTITRAEFLNPLPNKQYGYGLAQWTSPSRKAGLYDYIKSKNASIGNLESQLEFLKKEMESSYKTLVSNLKNATSVYNASSEVLVKFERPADQSDSVKTKRASYGQKYYDEYHGTSISKSTTDTVQTSESVSTVRTDYPDTSKFWGIVSTTLNIRVDAGTNYMTTDFSPLAKGVIVKVLGEKIVLNKKWYYVCYNNQYGYCSSSYITKKTITSAPKLDKTLAGVYTVTASSLNLRSKYGTDATTSILQTLSNGDKVTCYGYYSVVNNTNWLYVKIPDGLTGWVSSKYLKK